MHECFFPTQITISCKLVSGKAKPLGLLLDLTFDIFSKFNLPFPLVFSVGASFLMDDLFV